MIKIAPSILAADMARLGEEISSLAPAGADWVHFDVMDGHYVPNLSFGPAILKALRPLTPLPIDVHLMADMPERLIDAFIGAGADMLTFHVEVEKHPEPLLRRIRAAGKMAGLALSPATPLIALEYLLDACDLVLLMSVNPGFGGQGFLPFTLEKIKTLRRLLAERGLNVEISVDGGINRQTAREAAGAGATVLVAGTAVFAAKDRKEEIHVLRGNV